MGRARGAGGGARPAAADHEARGDPFDVLELLSDIMMPRMDGLESLRRVRAELPPGRLPYAIALSANVGARNRVECADAGFDAFLAKPVRGKELAMEEALVAAAGRLAPCPRASASAEVAGAPPAADPDPAASAADI
eukprot:tig00021621_g22958.t1